MKCKSALFACLQVGKVCLLAFVFTTNNSNAQTKYSSVPQHDSLNFNDSANNINKTDTILKWKKNRQFAYINYLDSLLRKQKNLRSDTVTFDESTGTIIRKRSFEKQPSAANKVMNSLPLRIFFWILAIVFIGFICYKVLFQNAIFRIRKKKFVRTDDAQEKRLLSGFMEYDSLIDAAEKNNKFNSATRYLFLKTLKNLSDKAFIDYEPQKTNKDYLKEMNANKYFNDFKKLTRYYEYAWYGKFLMNKMKYANIKEEFYFFNEKV